MSDICKYCNFDEEDEELDDRMLDTHKDNFGLLGGHEQYIYITNINKKKAAAIYISDEFYDKDGTATKVYGKNIYISFCPFCGRKL